MGICEANRLCAAIPSEFCEASLSCSSDPLPMVKIFPGPLLQNPYSKKFTVLLQLGLSFSMIYPPPNSHLAARNLTPIIAPWQNGNLVKERGQERMRAIGKETASSCRPSSPRLSAIAEGFHGNWGTWETHLSAPHTLCGEKEAAFRGRNRANAVLSQIIPDRVSSSLMGFWIPIKMCNISFAFYSYCVLTPPPHTHLFACKQGSKCSTHA